LESEISSAVSSRWVNLSQQSRVNFAQRYSVFTPWLLAGEHRVRIYWDNARAYKSLLIQAVRLQALLAADANGNGIKDWIEQRLKSQNGVELAVQGDAPPVIYRPIKSSGNRSICSKPAFSCCARAIP
jgi:hypothetical protein